VAAFALVGGVVSLLYSDRLAESNARLDSARRAAEEGWQQATWEKTRADHLLYTARIPQAHNAWVNGNLPLARRLLAEQAPADGRPDFRGFEWDYLDALFRREGEEMARHPGGANAVAFSPDGERLASAGADGKILLWKDGVPGKAVALEAQKELGQPLSLGF